MEQRQRARAAREAMREQRAKSRKLIVSVALKLHEKESQIQEVRSRMHCERLREHRL